RASRNPSKPDEGSLYGARHAPRGEHTDRKDRATAHAAASESKRRPAVFDIDDETGNRVDHRDAVSARVDRQRRCVTDIGKGRAELHEERALGRCASTLYDCAE